MQRERLGARTLGFAARLYGPALPHLSLVRTDAGYSGHLARDLRRQVGWTLEVVKRTDLQPHSSFAVQVI